MKADGVILLPRSAGSDILHVVGPDGLTLCGHAVYGPEARTSGPVCVICRAQALNEGYKVKPSYPMDLSALMPEIRKLCKGLAVHRVRVTA